MTAEDMMTAAEGLEQLADTTQSIPERTYYLTIANNWRLRALSLIARGFNGE